MYSNLLYGHIQTQLTMHGNIVSIVCSHGRHLKGLNREYSWSGLYHNMVVYDQVPSMIVYFISYIISASPNYYLIAGPPVTSLPVQV